MFILFVSLEEYFCLKDAVVEVDAIDRKVPNDAQQGILKVEGSIPVRGPEIVFV